MCVYCCTRPIYVLYVSTESRRQSRPTYLQKSLVVGPTAQQPLLLELDEQTPWLLGDKVDHRLVVLELDRGPVQPADHHHHNHDHRTTKLGQHQTHQQHELGAPPREHAVEGGVDTLYKFVRKISPH